MLSVVWPAHRAIPAARRAVLSSLTGAKPAHTPAARRAATMTALPPPAAGAVQGALSLPPSAYPSVRRDDAVVDIIHGVSVPDPYRWLEDPDSAETEAWVEAQNKVTASILDQCETRPAFKALMTRLYDYPRFGLPRKHGSRYVYSSNTGLQPQSVMYSAAEASPTAEKTVLLDPNQLSTDGTVALSSTSFSKDGKLMAYSISSGGSDWVTIHVMSVDQATGAPTKLSDELKHAKFSSLAWTHDHKGFFYHRYPAPDAKDLGTEVDSNQNKQMWYHAIGRPQSEDVFLWDVPEHPTWHLGAEVTDDGNYLLLTLSSGCEPKNRLYYLALESLPRGEDGILDLGAFDRRKGADAAPLPIVKLVDDFEASWDYVANVGSVFTFQTNYKAPRNRLLRTDIAAPTPPDSWEVVIPEHAEDLLQWASALAGDALVVCWLRNVCSVLELRSLESGELTRAIPLPGLGSVASFSGDRRRTEAFFSFTSFVDPGSAYRFDVTDPADPTLYRKTELKGGYTPADDFTTSQAWATSADGTRVPYFLIHRKGVTPPGGAGLPALLYGYGGFNISLEPGFSLARLCWLVAYGGVAAVANLRGGGEFGVGWRDAGSSRHKQNVFSDFQACAEHMIEAGWTSPGRLAIQGGSNGGLLVAACVNQRPDLYAAALAQVGVMDMLRFHRFTIGHAWQTDYGFIENEDDFKTLLAYSPLHNVRVPGKDGKGQYPAVMLTTGDHDDRVVPLHSHKLTAALQHELATGPGEGASPQRNPLITRIQVRGGHGAGKPTELVIAEVSDMYAFAAKCMGAGWVGDAALE